MYKPLPALRATLTRGEGKIAALTISPYRNTCRFGEFAVFLPIDEKKIEKTKNLGYNSTVKNLLRKEVSLWTEK